jgi:hypothetical protein
LGKAPDGEDKSFFKRELKNLNGEVVKWKGMLWNYIVIHEWHLIKN